MKLERATRTWLIFATLAALAVLGSGVLRVMGLWGHGALFGAFAVSIAVLIALAIRLASAKPRLNLTLAAETLVALGIFSLISSIAVVLFKISDFMTEITSSDLSIEDMRRFAWPFGEGLAAAAIAPFVATLLRHVESNISTVESGEAGMVTAAREAETLAAELKATTANIQGVNAELAGTTHAFERALGSAVKATGTLSATLQTEAERLKLALQRVQAEVTALADASQKGRIATSELGTGLTELNASTKDARELLDALGSGKAGMVAAAREAETLAAELKATTANIQGVNAELTGTKHAFEKALGSAVKATGTLSATLQTEAERLKLALQRVEAEVTALADASQKGRIATSELGTGLTELNASTKDARELLDALGKLIESVERYIKPDRRV